MPSIDEIIINLDDSSDIDDVLELIAHLGDLNITKSSRNLIKKLKTTLKKLLSSNHNPSVRDAVTSALSNLDQQVSLNDSDLAREAPIDNHPRPECLQNVEGGPVRFRGFFAENRSQPPVGPLNRADRAPNPLEACGISQEAPHNPISAPLLRTPENQETNLNTVNPQTEVSKVDRLRQYLNNYQRGLYPGLSLSEILETTEQECENLQIAYPMIAENKLTISHAKKLSKEIKCAIFESRWKDFPIIEQSIIEAENRQQRPITQKAPQEPFLQNLEEIQARLRAGFTENKSPTLNL